MKSRHAESRLPEAIVFFSNLLLGFESFLLVHLEPCRLGMANQKNQRLHVPI